jgi:phenylalanyl-tRNA synthetase alpha chain
MNQIDIVKEEFRQKVTKSKTLEDIEALRVEFLSKKGKVTSLLSVIPTIDQLLRKDFGAAVNLLKDYCQEQIERIRSSLEIEDLNKRLERERLDITLSRRAQELGKQHPISKTIQEIENIFKILGFSIIDGIEIDDDKNNFDYLNIPDNHPARQMHDTFYTNDGRLLRTHTSNMQVRYMKGKPIPIKFVNIGKVYRSDDDATHSPMFHQLEVVCVDTDITMANLKWLIEEFLSIFFEINEAPIRMRSSYFPFTEPSVEIDVKCNRSSKSEITIGKGEDWLEIMGAGMIHPNVLKSAEIDATKYRGFALGCGIERLAMLKYNIPDLRKFYEGNVAWLKHYGF